MTSLLAGTWFAIKTDMPPLPFETAIGDGYVLKRLQEVRDGRIVLVNPDSYIAPIAESPVPVSSPAPGTPNETRNE